MKIQTKNIENSMSKFVVCSRVKMYLSVVMVEVQGNAIHIANDFIYGVACNNKEYGGIRIEALSANPSVITCLANDVSYDSIYSEQLKVS